MVNLSLARAILSPMGSICFLVLSAPYTYQNMHTVVHMANTALDKGHEVTGIYLFVDGVLNANRNIEVEGDMMSIPDELEKLSRRGVPISLCSACAAYRGLLPGNVVDGVEFAGMAVFSEYFEEADKVLVFGM
ncbi:MAG: DsrE/DsrF/TusD sulfur relay family protein [Promethearchaeota archaeon]